MTTWIKCSDQMPPDDETEIIVIMPFSGALNVTTGHIINLAVTLTNEESRASWCLYTPELWEKLNNEE